MTQLTLTGYHLQGWVRLVATITSSRERFVRLKKGLVHLTAYNHIQHHVTPIHVGNTSCFSVHSWASVLPVFRPAGTTFSSYRFCDSMERLLDFCSIISILRISFIALDHQTTKSRQTREFTDKIWFKSRN